MKPVIGITMSHNWEEKKVSLAEGYTRAIQEVGGLPLLLYPGGQDDMIQVSHIVNGLLLSGGWDVDPAYFGEEPALHLGNVYIPRDQWEIKLVQQFSSLNKPILGICRGIQLLNVALGGNLYQDIDTQFEGNPLQHHQLAPVEQAWHGIEIQEGSRLASILEAAKAIRVNSFHHQAVKQLGAGLSIVASSKDGIIEAVEGTYDAFLLGVQWHPELMWEKDKKMMDIFKAFVEACYLLM